MAVQNRRRSSRPATGGRPGDNNGGRPDRAERRFRSTIATSPLKVLRRPVEFTQFTSAGFLDELESHDIRVSMDGKGRFLDNIFIERLWRSLKYEDVVCCERVVWA